MVWTTAVFNFYMIQFLLDTFDQVYEVSMMSAVSDIIGFLFAGIAYSKLGPKLMLVCSNGLSAAGGASILFYGLNHQSHWSFPILIFISKFGIACSLNTLFVAHSAIFPLLFSATSLGIV